jgi:hypothetical protein
MKKAKKKQLFLHTIEHKTCWDPKKRRCPTCKIEDRPAILGVDMKSRPYRLFCAFCFRDAGFFEGGDEK